ncbi:PilZ domain-containing protein [Bdellovibrio svalbardensis]|uniref:PilZ domain-containing protein n=1 Tax=Bdellovibrio svalbardensis TaxID=2972972 RepID=A0ABT6DLA2_9BACT|nr:PilZ domain-containing protein [Bdellovibrio svalbardensis]MDG0817292.1 PilZ domain-containing protein [Bdellovibrio svalbardensis]
MATQYFLSTGKQKIGPLSERAVQDGVRSGKIQLFDMILNAQTNEWVMLMQHPDFSDLENGSDDSLNEERSQKESHAAVGLISDSIDEDTRGISFLTPDNIPILTPVYWYEKDNAHKRLKYLEVLSMIHSQKLSEQSLISKNPTGPWRKLVDWEDFSPASLENYKQVSKDNLPDINIRRKFPRFECGKVFVVLSKGKGYQAFCPDISKSGLAFIVRSPKADLNDPIVIKFNDSLTGNKFDAKGVVVSVRKVRLPGSESIYIRYGVRFTHLSESGRDFILAAAASDKQAA